MSSSTVIYTSVYSDFEPWRFKWVFDEELEALVEAPQLPEQAPPSPDYVPGPEHPPSPDYVPGLEYPEYLVPADDEAPIEDQPLPVDASPTALSPGYVADSDREDDPEEDPEKDPADYPTDGGDKEEEESSGDNADDEDEEEASKDDDEEEEEHLVPAESFVVPAVNPVPSAEIQRHLRPMSLHPHHHHLDFAGLGYLFDPRHRYDFIEADMPLQKRACFVAPTGRFEVGESLSDAARQAGHTLAHRVDYGFIDTVDANICASESRVLTAVGKAWVYSKSKNQVMEAQIRDLQRDVDVLQRMDQLMLKMPPKRTTTPMSNVIIKALVAQSVADALAEHEANRSRNGDDNHDSGTYSRRTERAARECTYSDFLKCQPLNFKGTEG
ncbi:hypothetical protein Tco_0227764 [Tanacetum coccineum]